MDIQILDSMLLQYETIFTGGITTVHGYAVGTLWLLVGIDFVLSVLLNLQDGDHFLKNLLSKILKYGFWVWVVDNYGELVDIILDSLTTVGFSVGGGMSNETIKHPSTICGMGLEITQPYLSYLEQQTSMELFFSNAGTNLLVFISILAILIAFMILAIQVCVTYIEFYLSATLLFIFIPFGANKYMSFLAEKAIGAVFAFGVKLMVMGAVIGISGPIVNSWATKFVGEPKYSVMFATVTAACLLTFLAWQAPSLAAGMMSGAPTLSAGTVAGMGLAAGAAAVGGGMAAAAAAKMAGAAGFAATKAAAALGGGAARTGAAVAGAAIAGGSNVDSNTAPITGAAQGVANLAGNAVKGAAASVAQGVSSAASGMKEALGSAYQKGAENSTPTGRGSGGGGGSAASGSTTGTTSAASAASTASTATGSSGMGNMMAAGQAAQRAVPPEAAPQGGMSVPIRHDD